MNQKPPKELFEEAIRPIPRTDEKTTKERIVSKCESISDQQSIDFSKWLPDNAYISENNYYWILFETGNMISEEDLLTKFKSYFYK